MKLIKKGSENAEFGKDLVCKGEGFGKGKGGCGAVLHVVPADIVENVYVDYENSYYFVCLECFAKTYIKPSLFK